MKKIFLPIFLVLILSNCVQTPTDENTSSSDLTSYISLRLTTDLSALSENDKQVLPYLFKAADIMNDIYWIQAYGDKQELMSTISSPKLRQFAEWNYGPWDNLNGDAPFLDGIENRPPGANLYPNDMSKEEFEKLGFPDEKNQYTLVRRDEVGKIYIIPYNEYFKQPLEKAADYLNKAADVTTDVEFKNYLKLRAKALLSNEYDESDIAWLKMKNNTLDIIIGPIETYDDGLYDCRTAFEAYVLVKDKSWSKKLEKYTATLPQLQRDLPVKAKYKSAVPNNKLSQLNAYDVIYYAGQCNRGSKTIAVNLPNSETLKQKYGTRRSQLKNAMKAKFDHILVPLANELIAEDQIKHITFNAFFNNTMFHEVAHGLGIFKTINTKEPVSNALQEHTSALEEGKADVLGLFMVTQLKNQGILEEGELEDYYVTFMASILRSVRFGVKSAHGKANMLRFNYFQQKKAFQRNANGRYEVDMKKMGDAITSLSKLILEIQGDGNKDKIDRLMKKDGIIKPDLQADLNKLNGANIPVDVVFEQGLDVLGIKP